MKSSYGKYLNVDLIAGGKIELRADETEEMEGECWSIWMQGEYLSKARKAVVERSGIKAESVAEGLVIVGDMRGAENDYMYVLYSLSRDVSLTMIRCIVKSIKRGDRGDWSVLRLISRI